MVKNEYYVNGKELIAEIRIYKNEQRITEKLGEFLTKIARRYSTKPNFSGYSYKDDFVADAIYRMIEQIDKINLDHPRCNPFAYLTQTCKNCFRAKINKEHRIQTIKENARDTIYSEFTRTEDL